MKSETLQTCQKLIDYTFRDEQLLALALTHSSVAATRTDSNERLEFLGDAVLGVTICHDLYGREPVLQEGEMTKIKSSVVSRQTCAAVAEELGLCDLLHLGKGVAQRDGLPQSVAAAVFESIIGAVFLDGGLDAARPFILRSVAEHLDEALATEHQRNYKSILQQHAQRRWSRTPEYHLLDEKGPDHSKAFEIAVTVEGQIFPSAWGKTKKDAEQQAALRALQALGLLTDPSDDDPDGPDAS